LEARAVLNRTLSLVLIVLIYTAGIIAGANILLPLFLLRFFLIVLLLLLSAAVVLRKHRRVCLFSIYLSLFFFSLIYTALCLDFSRLEKFENERVGLTGVVISDPDIGKWQTNLIVEAEKLELSDGKIIQPVASRVFVKIGFSKKDIFYGEKYKFSGILRIPPDGEFKRYLQRNKISATMNVYSRKKIQYIGEGKANPFLKAAFKLKEKLIGAIEHYVPPNYSPLLIGMMFERGAVPFQIREMFAQVGVVHVLAISGLHVGIMSGIFLLMFRFLRVPRRISYSIAFVLVTVYALITGLGVPVVRAALMLNLFFLGYIIRRRTNIFITLTFASLLILLWNPYYLFDIGFQLSFITVLCIVLITPKLEKPFRKKVILPIKIFLVSIAAWLGSLPLVAYYFGYISWIGPFSNLFVIPLVTLILACGFILLIFALAAPFACYFLGSALKILLMSLLRIVEIVSSLPFVYSEVTVFPLEMVFAYYSILLLFIYYPKIREFIRNARDSENAD
jgi:competence protein ComEC